jgi:mRNA-degrading endonuclease RelE of RelBE toxin-antitoxin system
LGKRFDMAIEQIKAWIAARRKREPIIHEVFLLRKFAQLLEEICEEDGTMDKNFIAVLKADPDRPKRGRNVDGTRCHKTEMKKGNRGGMYRLLYYHSKSKNAVFFILLYAKTDQDNLTAAQAKKLNEVTDGIDAGKYGDFISLDV